MDGKLKILSADEQKNIWKNNLENLKGSQIAGVVYMYSKKYLGRKIVDFGAGDGSFVKVINSEGKKSAIGIDMVPKEKSVLKRDIRNTKFKNAEFDTVVSTDVIEHLTNKDLDLTVLEMNRVLKIGGNCIITTLYNEKLENSQIICPCCNVKFHKWGHCQSFNYKNIRELFEKFGFKIILFKKTSFSLLVEHPILSRFIYSLSLDFYLAKNHPFVHKDFLVIVKKVKNVKN